MPLNLPGRLRRVAPLAVVAAALLFVTPAYADGAQSIASAPAIVYGQQEFGNTANGSRGAGGSDDCWGFQQPVRSFWSLSAVAGDAITIDWEASQPGTCLAVYPPGTTDFNLDAARPLVVGGLGSNNKQETKLRATSSGSMPVMLWAPPQLMADGMTDGPYDLTAYVRHAVRLAVPRVGVIARNGKLSVAVHTPEGGNVSDSSLRVDVQLRRGKRWLGVGWATVDQSVATVVLKVPSRYVERVVRLRAYAHGDSYKSAASRSWRAIIIAPARRKERHLRPARAAAAAHPMTPAQVMTRVGWIFNLHYEEQHGTAAMRLQNDSISRYRLVLNGNCEPGDESYFPILRIVDLPKVQTTTFCLKRHGKRLVLKKPRHKFDTTTASAPIDYAPQIAHLGGRVAVSIGVRDDQHGSAQTIMANRTEATISYAVDAASSARQLETVELRKGHSPVLSWHG